MAEEAPAAVIEAVGGEQEVAPATETEQQEGVAAAKEEKGPFVPLEYDESLLILVKGRPKRPTKPDTAERDSRIQLLKEEMDSRAARIKEIKEIIDGKLSSNRGGSGPQAELRQKLQGLRNEWNAVLVRYSGLK